MIRIIKFKSNGVSEYLSVSRMCTQNMHKAYRYMAAKLSTCLVVLKRKMMFVYIFRSGSCLSRNNGNTYITHLLIPFLIGI